MVDVAPFRIVSKEAAPELLPVGVELVSIAHPASAEPELPLDLDINPESIERVEVDIPESWIPTLEERRLSDKPLFLEDLVKIDGITHVWMGDGWVAVKYAKQFVWKIQQE